MLERAVSTAIQGTSCVLLRRATKAPLMLPLTSLAVYMTGSNTPSILGKCYAVDQELTIEMAKSCSTLTTSTEFTLQERSSDRSNPTYFHPLSVPPAPPNWNSLQHTSVEDVVAQAVKVAETSQHHQGGLPKLEHHHLPRPAVLPPGSDAPHVGGGSQHSSGSGSSRTNLRWRPYQLGSESPARIGLRAARIYGITKDPRLQAKPEHAHQG